MLPASRAPRRVRASHPCCRRAAGIFDRAARAARGQQGEGVPIDVRLEIDDVTHHQHRSPLGHRVRLCAPRREGRALG